MCIRDRIDTVDMHGRTPLHHAVLGGKEIVACYLMCYGVDLDAQDLQGNTPMQVAILNFDETSSFDMVKKLLLFGADRETRNSQGKTVLQLVQEKIERGNKPKV